MAICHVSISGVSEKLNEASVGDNKYSLETRDGRKTTGSSLLGTGLRKRIGLADKVNQIIG